MRRKTDEAVREAVSMIFQTGYFGRSEYAIPRDSQLSITESASAFGNSDGFQEKADDYFERMRHLPCFSGMSEEQIREILSKRMFQVVCGKGEGAISVLESAYELRRRYGLRKFLLLTDGAAEREQFLRTLSVMLDYFSDKYCGLELGLTSYDSERVENVRSYALSDDIQLMIVNKEYFIRSNNLLKRPSSHLEGASPVSILQPARCVAFTSSENIRDVSAILRHSEIFHPLCTICFTETEQTMPDIVKIEASFFQRDREETGSAAGLSDLQFNI